MKGEMLVRKIENGSVIDHISAGKGLKVAKILNIGDEDKAVVLMNVESRHFGRKDIVKIENKELDENEVNKIALVSPQATLNIIKNRNVAEKRKVSLPNVIEKIVKCPNKNCITNTNEPIETKFFVESIEPTLLRCNYCERNFSSEEILI